MRALAAFAVPFVFLTAFSFPASAGNTQCMVASYYHEGTRTATGERYNADGLSAAHRTLSFGTRLRITRGGHAVNVRINDRGPARWTGRDIDLSRGAARALGMLQSGVGRVCVEVLETGKRLIGIHSHRHHRKHSRRRH